jgi:DNA polymerase (family 10)
MQEQLIHTKSANNHALANLFQKMSLCYRYLGAEQRFRALAYEQAAKTIANMREDVASIHDLKKLDELKGVGKHIAQKIIEYLDTGKIQTYEVLSKKLPVDLLPLADIEGVGPATIRHLHDQLKIENLTTLSKKLADVSLVAVKGVDKTKLQKIRKALNVVWSPTTRFSLAIALKIAQPILDQIKNIEGVMKVYLAGSLRREKSTIGDLDILVIANKKKHGSIMSGIIQLPQIKRAISQGIKKSSLILNQANMQMDVRIVLPDQEGSALLYFTGSKAFNIRLRKLALQQGLLLNEYGLFRKSDGKQIAGKTEAEIFSALGLRFVKPEDREDEQMLLYTDNGK